VQRLHQHAPGPILYWLNGTGLVRWIASNIRRDFGLEPTDLFGRALHEFITFDPPNDTAANPAGLQLRTGRLRTAQGEVAVSITETRGEGLPGLGAIAPLDAGDTTAPAPNLGPSAPVLLWQIALDTRQLQVQGALAQTLGYSDGVISGNSWSELVHPEDWAIALEHTNTVLQGLADRFEIEARVQQQDSEWLWTLTHGEVTQRDANGKPLRLSGVCIDITKQKASSAESSGHRALLRRSLRLARVAAWAYEPKSGAQIWTEEASELLGVPAGYVPDELLGLELFDGESQLRVRRALRRAIDEGIGFDQELLRITPQGRVLWLRVVANPEFEDGAMVRLSGLFQDVTRQRRMEQAVRDSEQLLKQLTSGVPGGIFQLRRSAEASYHLDFISAGVRRLLDIPDDAPLPDFKQLYDALEATSQSALLRSLDRAAAQRSLWSLELNLKSQGDETPKVLLGRAQPESQLDGTCLYYGFLNDITEQRRQEDALRDAEASQQRLARLEAVGQLAGGIAHDFNNYLTSIVMSLSLLEAQPELSRDALQLVREALSATSSAQSLTRQLLTFSRGAAPVKQVIETELLVREAVAFTLRGSALEARVHAQPKLWSIEVDPGQMQQVLQNLVINASQAMSGRGLLRVELSNVPASEFDLVSMPIRDYVKIEVIDRGGGVPEAIRGKLFQPYVTSKENGSGLGLASAFSIVRRHDGMIVYTHEPEAGMSGSAFSVWLPAHKVRSEERSTPSGMPSGSGDILVMDDNDGILKMLTRALSHLGFTAAIAHDGEEARRILSDAMQAGRKFSAVILDQTIPGGVGGAEALKLLRELDPHLRAIATSGYTEADTMSRFQDFGFSGVLKKPFRIQDLARVLQEILSD
jgi:PAS domain S-box-containing protein